MNPELNTADILSINGEEFDVIKPTRLLPGMVLKSRVRDAFARLGPKQSTLDEQLHTASLLERGFPVAKILESGPFGDDEWYFVEESLGDTTFHDQFKDEYEAQQAVSEATFDKYRDVVGRYIDAQFNPKNRAAVSIDDFIVETIPESEITANYQLCGGDVARYQAAIEKASVKLNRTAMGLLQFDFNPYNILERGMIDFEMAGYGPLGYDALTVSLWHRWFTNDSQSRYRVAYVLSEEQIQAVSELVGQAAKEQGVPDPRNYIEEFLLIKTAWAFSSEKSIYKEPESKQSFYLYRAALLQNAVDSYLSGRKIDVLNFPAIRPLENNL